MIFNDNRKCIQYFNNKKRKSINQELVELTF